jgi:hypothetical protein
MRRPNLVVAAALAALACPGAFGACDGSGSKGRPQVPGAVDLARWDPSFYRAAELSLDGPWLFRKDPDRQGDLMGLAQPGSEAKYDATITVPYPWQSSLSGVGEPAPATYAMKGSEAALQTYRGTAWYARTVEVPADFPAAGRTFLRFGAVDWKARVFVDGTPAGEHEGGYDPFDVDVTQWATPGGSFYVAVEAVDPCDGDAGILTGKQGGAWYTCGGGIWQSVTLLARPVTHVASVRDVPGTAAGALATKVTVRGDGGQASVRVTWECMAPACPVACGATSASVTVIATPEGASVDIPIQVPAADEWSPESPCLVGRVIEVTDAAGATDTVNGYFGARRIRTAAVPGIDADSAPQPWGGILVNDRMVYVRAALDQAYHPDGILQYPSPTARREDLAFLKRSGFNTVRIHIKPEEPRVYAMADALGLFVIYDLPTPAPSKLPAPGAPWNAAFDHLLEAAIARDANHPSILWWVVFNEAWGLSTPGFWTTDEGIAFVKSRWLKAKELDPTRPVEDNSPTVYDGHAQSDLATWHAYSSDIPFFEEMVSMLEPGMTAGGATLLYGADSWTGQPWINTEFGGLSAMDSKGDHGFLIHGLMNVLRRHAALVGYVFTEAYDVEWERNGLMTYDRRPKDFGLDELGMTLPDIFGEAYLVLGMEPIVAALPGAVVTLSAGLSTPATLDATTMDVELRRRDGTVMTAATLPVTRCGPGTTPLPDVTATLPDGNEVYVLAARVKAGDRVLAKNAAYVVADGGLETEDPTGQARLEQWGGWIDSGLGSCAYGACWCQGDCSFTYTLYGLGYGRRHLRLVAEVAAYDPDMPQTDDRVFPSRLEVEVDGEHLASVDLPDAPNDHRGVLSLSRSYSALRGSYGQVVRLDLGTRDVTDVITVRLRGVGGGLTIFGRDGGRTLEAPRIEWEEVR